ncbi:hypothetical protein TSUD_08630 [Trifolium subterraneum]|nr:hypothetical protein TSUD_08630 [Trifolium subterraneum]
MLMRRNSFVYIEVAIWECISYYGIGYDRDIGSIQKGSSRFIPREIARAKCFNS